MSTRVLCRLQHRYRGASRMSIYRLRQQVGFPAGVRILGREYHYEDELEVYEAQHRTKPSDDTGGTDTTTPTP